MNKNLAFGLLLLGMAFMGVAFVFVKDAVTSYSPFVFLFYRFLISTVILSVIFSKNLKQINIRTFEASFLCGIPLFFSIFFQTIGLRYTSVANSAFITGMVVLLIPIFKLIFYKKKVKFIIWISCLVAAIGLFIITLKNGLQLNIGDTWTFACAIALAFYVLQTGKFAEAPNPMARVTIIMAICTIGSLFGEMMTVDAEWFPLDFNFWKGVIFSAIFGTVYMYSVQNYVQRFISEEKVALAYLTEPIFATVSAVILIDEKVNINTFLGGGLILLAMFLSELRTANLKRFLNSTKIVKSSSNSSKI
ncbi:DMT family transporter [Sphingobacterium sp. DR205]|uniref:DMT family transporter n=1 Tax=Sphingobacterium sp. DR205 TaxID=2713573 RepID=UPI0013E4E8D0|nr:DMT family transporter [Sphingobacterium sp. DR205]QIH34563.1 DMT family transporter [Sphingobacterium sp. DR205]